MNGDESSLSDAGDVGQRHSSVGDEVGVPIHYNDRSRSNERNLTRNSDAEAEVQVKRDLSVQLK